MSLAIFESQSERRGAIRAGHANVDRRGLAEVQDLVNDVGGLEEKLQLRESFGQFAPQICDMRWGWRMPLLERDENFAVHWADGRRNRSRRY